ncbi:CDP-alcohol phosphatidyltransferase family protein [Umezawaea sp. Da 62-37]|uniref:CDP-alcohol phosphatidyltransferase family protein n=1 Tax=Umezawaea sp. Da 62-37 TaxID=3075927 RepID=UPI0028F6D02D|nr:CDP-alcohol phosphatidyltransferase family protein [Umezawaea sp. Da 62-37]WNV87600.1 CDP-alcohol phosphatidyltransferase family protein [Umezawaea sp. Da 62-37]
MTGDGQGARPPVDPVAGWSRLHGEDVSTSRVVVIWLRVVHGLAAGRFLGRVHPDVLSAASVVVAAAAVAVVAAGGRWPLAASALVLAAGVLDGLDGAVALRTGRARPLGAVVDAVSDRLADLCLVGILVVLGADSRLGVALGAGVLLHEYARAKAQSVGMGSAGSITVAERPTRIIVAVIACAGAGLAPTGTPGTGWDWGVVCGVVWAACAVVGGVQLVIGIRRELAGRPWVDPTGSATSGRTDLSGDDRG